MRRVADLALLDCRVVRHGSARADNDWSCHLYEHQKSTSRTSGGCEWPEEEVKQNLFVKPFMMT
jgi:hypothetical protein